MQGNLLRVQLQKKSLMDCDTSSAASTTNEVSSSPIIPASCGSGIILNKTKTELQAQKHQPSSGSKLMYIFNALFLPNNNLICNMSYYLYKLSCFRSTAYFASFPNYLFKITDLETFAAMKMKLALPLKQRLLVDSSQDDSSSTDSTPQRRKTRSEVPKELSVNAKQTNISRPKPNAPLLGRKMRNSGKSKFPMMSTESESCSSAMSSMESVRSSNDSGGSVQSLVSSSESGAGCSMSTSSNSNLSLPGGNKPPMLELRTHRSNLISNKFTVLSPISDKSQEQSSETGDSQRTPKVSPTDHILTSCCGMNPDPDTENNNANKDNNLPPAPFAMPKLQRKLMQSSKQYYHQSKTSIQGSDSGISMSSQDVQDMVELLKLPFDMPKLRRKTQHILLRPASMPINDIALRGQDKYLSASISNEAWPCPKPSDVSTGSTMTDNYQFQVCDNSAPAQQQLLDESGNAEPAADQTEILPVKVNPPPGFADENNQFYLTEDDMESTQSVGIRQGEWFRNFQDLFCNCVFVRQELRNVVPFRHCLF